MASPASERPGLYRSAALEHYIRSQEHAVLPRLVRPRVFRVLWVLVLLLGAGVLFASTVSVPTWHRGTGVVLGRAAAQGSASVAVFLPSSIETIRPGAMVVLEPEAGPGLHARVRSVQARVMGPGEAVRHFGLRGAAAAALRGPSVVVLSSLEAATPGGLPASAWEGSVLRARVRGGERRVISLLRAGEDR